VCALWDGRKILMFLTVALSFLFQPNISIASAAEFLALDPGFGLPAVLSLVGSMGGSLGSDFSFSESCQLNEVIHSAASLEIMAVLFGWKIGSCSC
jgi:Na+/glutamate symporter